MASTQNTTSPSRPRAKHHHQHQHHPQNHPSKGANPTHPNNNNNPRQSQRRQRGNRAHQGNNHVAQQDVQYLAATGSTAPADAFSESAVLSSEEMSLPTGPRIPKKHTRSQPSSDRVFSPTAIMSHASLTDSEAQRDTASATPGKSQGAYAGPTFHASPAPSALPIPKFLSRSVPAKTRQGPPTPPPEDASDSASSPTPSPPSPSRAPMSVPSRGMDSPLDMLFKADRAEKARNANFSPLSAHFPPSPNQPIHRRPSYSKDNFQGSLNVMFPIELDAEGQRALQSPSAVPPVVHRSVTAPSKIPQPDGPVGHNNDPAIQDLLDRLSLSQSKPIASSPPKTGNNAPSDPSSRNHTPSPFHDGQSSLRSASGPTTPAAANQQDQPDFFYGNRNLSPLFKAAARPDLSKRNSGLRTEITADSPLLPQGGFSPVNGAAQANVSAASHSHNQQVFVGPPPTGRRGSAPQVPQHKDASNHRKPRTPGRGGPHRGRPESFPHGNHVQPSANTTTATVPKVNPFVPSSVKAKHYGSPSKPLEASPSLEQDLKRLLNIKSN